jgi:hypothetical protein
VIEPHERKGASSVIAAQSAAIGTTPTTVTWGNSPGQGSFFTIGGATRIESAISQADNRVWSPFPRTGRSGT